MERIKRNRDEAGWYFGGRLRRSDGLGQIVARVDDLDGYSATALQRVMRQEEAFRGVAFGLQLSEQPEHYFDEDYAPIEPISFSLVDSSLALSIALMLNKWIDQPDEIDQPDDYVALTEIFKPVLARNRLSLHRLERDDHYVGPPWLWRADLIINTRNRSLVDLYRIGKDIIALVEAMQTGQLTRETAGDLIRGGHAAVLVGQPEGDWLDVKSQQYDLTTLHGQIALAQAVARFANAEAGGLVVIGMATKKIPGGEIIKKLCPVPIDGHTIRRHQQALETRLFPPPDHLAIETIPTGAGGLVLIDIPPQPEELKPFLVHGAILDGRVEGSFISIVRRRGESSIPVTATMIHSTLAAGRALLRRGQLP